MEHWNLREFGVEPQHPQVLHSTRGEARSIVLALRTGENLSEHQVHERAHVLVIDGEVEIDGASNVTGGPGLLAVFDPGEPHSVRALSDARLLLVLAPWPGAGHPGARD